MMEWKSNKCNFSYWDAINNFRHAWSMLRIVENKYAQKPNIYSEMFLLQWNQK